MKIKFALFLLAVLATGCKKNLNPVIEVKHHVFNKIVILGNSITLATGTAGTEWVGPWGMAASAAEFDYVHLLIRDFKTLSAASKVDIKNIAAFERDFMNYDFDTNLKELKDSKPELLIIRIGENVTLTGTNNADFAKRYQDLVAYFKSNNAGIHILGVGSIWINEAADSIMAKDSEFITLKNLNPDPANFAYGNYIDPGIAQHPSDKGMKAIEEMIFIKVKTFL